MSVAEVQSDVVEAAYEDVYVESTVIATVLLMPRTWGIASGLAPGCFADTTHALVWDCAQTVHARGETVTPQTVDNELLRRDRLQTQRGRMGPLHALDGEILDMVRFDEAVRLIRRLAAARAVARAAKIATMQSAMLPAMPPAQYVSEVVRAITEAATTQGTGGVRSSADVASEWYEAWETMTEGGMRRARFGLTKVDAQIGDGRGMEEGRLYVVAGRPGMGKSGVGISALLTTANAGGNAIMFSLEMPRREVMDRMCASVAEVDARRIQSKQLSAEEAQRVIPSLEVIARLPWFIDDTGSLPISEIRARALTQHAKTPLSLVVIDHAHIVGYEPGTDDKEERHLSNVSHTCKALSKELACPVLLLMQLNRKCEERPNKRPQLSDLRGSGALEQDADMVLFVYRDEVYDRASPDVGHAELICAKQRNGPLFTARVAYNAGLTRFEDAAETAPKQAVTVVPVDTRYERSDDDF